MCQLSIYWKSALPYWWYTDIFIIRTFAYTCTNVSTLNVENTAVNCAFLYISYEDQKTALLFSLRLLAGKK
jgi:hypothetical protein